MKKPFYIFKGEKKRVLVMDYFGTEHELNNICIYGADGEVTTVFTGMRRNTDHYQDPNLEQNIIWEDT